jgi:hypothetical protein
MTKKPAHIKRRGRQAGQEYPAQDPPNLFMAALSSRVLYPLTNECAKDFVRFCPFFYLYVECLLCLVSTHYFFHFCSLYLLMNAKRLAKEGNISASSRSYLKTVLVAANHTLFCPSLSF